MKHLFSALAASLLLAAPAQAAQLPVPMGDPMSLAADVQLLSGKGLVTGASFAAQLDSLEATGRLAFLPTKFTDFFTGDVAFMFAPRLGQTLDLDLPVEIQPMAGLEGGMYLDGLLPAAVAASSTAANAYVAVPVGARVFTGVRGFVVSAQALYHYQVFDVLPTQYGYTTSRWHYEAAARMGSLAASAYYEVGPIWSGPGAKLGLNF